MSATSQTQPGQQSQVPGNGARATTRRPRGPNKRKTAAKSPTPVGMPPAITGAPTNVAARRIGPAASAVPVPTAAVTATPGSLAYLQGRQQECEIELRLIRSMIAAFGSRTAAGTTRRPTRKRAKRKARAKAA